MTNGSVPRTSGLLAHLVPNIGVIVVALVLAIISLNLSLLKDSDTGWHIRTGERILATGHIPVTDPYSFTRSGEPWYPWEWGADVMMGALHQSFGLPGVVFLFYVLFGICLWLYLRLSVALGGQLLVACVLMILSGSMMTPHLHARPHLFSWIFMLLAVWLAEKPPIRVRLLHLVGAVCTGALWANLHGSFFLGPFIWVIYAAGYFVAPFVWDLPSARRQSLWLVIFSVLFLAGTAIGPFGLDLHRHVWHYLGNGELLNHISEFRPFNFHDKGASYLAVALFLCLAGASTALSRGRVGRFVLTVAFCWMSVTRVRGIPLLGLAIIPLANASICEWLLTLKGLTRAASAAIRSFFDICFEFDGMDRKFKGTLPAAALALGFWFLLHAPPLAPRVHFDAERMPVGIAERVAQLPPQARVFAVDQFGGYLIYRFNGERKVYIDGRSDFYGWPFMKEYLGILETEPGWERPLARYEITHALVHDEGQLPGALRKAGWRELGRDKVAVLLEAPPPLLNQSEGTE